MRTLKTWKTWIATVLLACGASFAQAQSSSEASIEGVIRDQISAFESGDLAAAFDHASPAIRQMFRTPEFFGQMVREGYPMVWRPDVVTFGARETVPAGVRQRVVIRDGNGEVHFLEYEMLPVGESWKINGVRFLEPPRVGV